MQNRYHPLAAWPARSYSCLSNLMSAGRMRVINPGLRLYQPFSAPTSAPAYTRLNSLFRRTRSHLLSSTALVFTLLCSAIPAQAAITIVDAWARTTAPGQLVAAGYLRMMADQPMVLVGASSAFANKVELHDVQMDNGVMKMRQVSEMALEPKRVVELKPGGLHLMLTGIKGAVKVGDNIPLTLIFVDKHNRQENVNIILNGRAPPAYGMPAHNH